MDIASETASVTGSSKGAFTLDCIWYNIKNFWKGKKKAEETEEYEEHSYTPPLPSPTEDPFKKVPLKVVFDPSELKEGLLEFRKRKSKGTFSKNLIQFLPKHLRNLLQTRKQILKDKRIFRIGYTEETSEILQEFLKENMTVTEKILAAAFKNIGNALNVLGVRPTSGPPREYSIAKSNYFYDKAGEDVEE